LQLVNHMSLSKNDVKTHRLNREMFTMDQLLSGEHAIIDLESILYPSQVSGIVQVFQKTFRLGA
jgi:hypothetical protein